MIQFLADNIDQLDLALDQLAVGDRNFDRFAMMLIDNVIELTLHKYVKDEASSNSQSLHMYTRMAEMRQQLSDSEDESEESKHLLELIAKQKIIERGLGQAFDNKIKAAAKLGLVDSSTCETILYLHSYRNSAYHKGLRHESILHSLALFYFRTVCALLMAYKPRSWSYSSSTKLSHRAMKYLGEISMFSILFDDRENIFRSAYTRLDCIAASMTQDLVGDLSADISETIDSTDKSIDFLSNEGPHKRSRDDVVIYAQAWPFAFTKEADDFAMANGCKEEFRKPFVDWIARNYSWPVKSDPIPAWRKRHRALINEKDHHKALKRYCEFIHQTEDIRGKIDEAAMGLEMHIQHQIDVMRGK